MSSLLYLALSNAIQATLLAALVAVVTRFCRRPSVRHALWLLVLLKLITPPLIPIPLTWPRSEDRAPVFAEPLASDLVLPSRMEPGEPVPSLPDSELPSGTTTVREREDEPLPDGRGSPLLSALIVLWLGGSLVWWIVALGRLRRFRRLLLLAQLAASDVQEQGRHLAGLLGLRRCPPIVFVSALVSPMLWALGFLPRVLLPAELWNKLAAEQQDTLLAHELAHLRRGDHWVRRLELLVLGLYWWHPVVWWARRRLQEAEEECCDALVVALLPDAAPAYASALVQTVAFLSQSRPAALVGASGAGQIPLLKRRLTMILTETSSRKPSRIGFWIVLGMGAFLLPLAPQAAHTEAFEDPAAEEKPAPPIALDFGFPIADMAGPRQIKAGENCTLCHDPGMSGHGFQGKPQSWRETHDEIVRLMDELRRRQAEFHKALTRTPAAESPDHDSEIEKLQDEIELLKGEQRIKEARISGTKAMMNEQKRRLKNLEETNRSAPGAIPRDTLEEVRLAVTTQEAQLQINEAELHQAQIRLKQAERRLTRLHPPKPLQPPKPRSDKPAVPPKPQNPERLQELEKKLDELRKEMDNLRREMRPGKQRVPNKVDQAMGGFIYYNWPTNEPKHLEVNLPTAKKAFEMCKSVGDRTALLKLLQGTQRHAERLEKELAQLHPELVVEDEKEAKKLKDLREQISKLARDIEDYLTSDLNDK